MQQCLRTVATTNRQRFWQHNWLCCLPASWTWDEHCDKIAGWLRFNRKLAIKRLHAHWALLRFGAWRFQGLWDGKGDAVAGTVLILPRNVGVHWQRRHSPQSAKLMVLVVRPWDWRTLHCGADLHHLRSRTLVRRATQLSAPEETCAAGLQDRTVNIQAHVVYAYKL